MRHVSIAVILPTYKSKLHILDVINAIGDEVNHIIVVDDKCPMQTGKFVEQALDDSRLKVIYHNENQGVGGAVKTGYRYVLDKGIDIAIKIDSDGQMDPILVPKFIQPIFDGVADYTKGNRFFYPKDLTKMPAYRVIGNAGLSFLNKFSSGYWKIFDPANGYTAIRRTVLENIELDKIDNRYFFESDMLFRLGLDRCVVKDIPMTAVYGDEVSGLSARKIFLPFLYKLARNMFSRIGYQYFLRDFSVASVELIFGTLMFGFGFFTGVYKWIESIDTGVAATGGEVMLAALPIILGFQLLIAFLNFDIQNEPKN